jgi:diguanylate cyclase (GGDEF)-like protein/PAS domain S-box-containing protein
MKIKYDIIMVQIMLALFTVFILRFSFLYKEKAFIALTIYSVTLFVIILIVNINRAALRKREVLLNKKRINILLNTINANVVVWNSDYSSVIMNNKLKNLLGVSNETGELKSVFDKLFPIEIFGEKRNEELLKNRGQEVCIQPSDDKLFYTIWTTSVLLESKKNKFIMAIGLDITENKKIRQELFVTNKNLEKSEQRYKISTELSEIGILLDEGENLYFISNQLKKMLGLSSNNVTSVQLSRLVHPNDKILFDNYLKSASKHQYGIEDKIHSLELRMLSFDKEYHWYQYRYKSMTFDNNKNVFIGGAFIDITKDKEKDMLIERLAYIDDVTEIPNRNRLMIMGQEVYDCCKELGFSYWVIVLDIDRFHIVNDTCGYSNGNKILRDFAHIMYKYLSFGGFGARIGGDNFALIIKDYGDDDLPRKTVEKIQLDFSKLAIDVFSQQSLACSAGYSKMPNDGDNFADILDNSEFALSSGEKKRASIIGYDKNVHDTIIHGNTVEKALSKAIDNNELELFYQPKVNLNTGQLIGVEALIRWIKPDGQIILPGNFVPLAENSHLITRIGDYVMHEACRQNKIWQNLGLPKMVVSINLTSSDFYQNDIKQTIQDILARTKLEPQWLEIELTESTAMKDINFAVQQMDALRAMGVKLAMDDFGTGYSSLSYIQVMPITLLKLDKSFITNLDNDEIALEIVSAVIKIAKSKKIETIAEGIETQNQADILKRIGCDHAQGYLFGKPMRALEIIDYVKNTCKITKNS